MALDWVTIMQTHISRVQAFLCQTAEHSMVLWKLQQRAPNEHPEKTHRSVNIKTQTTLVYTLQTCVVTGISLDTLQMFGVMPEVVFYSGRRASHSRRASKVKVLKRFAKVLSNNAMTLNDGQVIASFRHPLQSGVGGFQLFLIQH